MTAKEKILLRIQHIDKRSFFRICLNFINFFMYFLILFISFMILEAVFDRGYQYYLSLPNFTTPVTIQSLSTQSLVQLFLVGDLTRILLLIGLFIGYCYFFHFLNTSGVNLFRNASSEQRKLGIAFFYLFFICLTLSFAIIFGILSPYFGSIEIMFLLYLFVTIILTMISTAILIVKTQYLQHTDLSDLINFFRKEQFYRKYTSITFYIFFLSLEMVVFGFIFNLNGLSVLCVIVLLLFIIWFLGIFNAFPDHASSIILTDKREISNVYIFNTEDRYIRYLSKEGWVSLNRDSVETVTIKDPENKTDKKLEPNQIIKEFILGSNFWNGLLNSIMVAFALIFAWVALLIPSNFPPNTIIWGYIITLGLISLPLLGIMKKYAIRYWM